MYKLAGILFVVQSDSSRQKGPRVPFLHCESSAGLLKELPSAVSVSCSRWDVLYNRDDSLAFILLLPTASSESMGHPRIELALLSSQSIFFLFLSVMVLE